MCTSTDDGLVETVNIFKAVITGMMAAMNIIEPKLWDIKDCNTQQRERGLRGFGTQVTIYITLTSDLISHT